MKTLVIMTFLISLIQSQTIIHGAGATFPAEIYQVRAFDYFKKAFRKLINPKILTEGNSYDQ